MELVLSSAGIPSQFHESIIQIIQTRGIDDNPGYLLEFINEFAVSKKIPELIERYKNDDLPEVFDMTSQDQARTIVRITNAFRRNKDIDQEAEKCRNCGAKMAVRDFAQMTSADELTRAFVKCIKCHYRGPPMSKFKTSE